MSHDMICGYTDPLSAAPGQPVAFKLSSSEPCSYEAAIVRILNGDTHPRGPGFLEVVVEEIAGSRAARPQQTDPGSFVLVENDGNLDLTGSITMHAFACPTEPDRPEQVVFGHYQHSPACGYALVLDRGRPGLWLADGARRHTVESPASLHSGCWYSIAATYDATTRTGRVRVHPVVSSVNSVLSPITEVPGAGLGEQTGLSGAGSLTGGGLTIAGCWSSAIEGPVVSHFNGKLQAPALWDRALGDAELRAVAAGEPLPRLGLRAAWDFSTAITPDGILTDEVGDDGPHGLIGRCVNFPTRGIPGWNWRGHEERYIHAPPEFAAAHFHQDDIEDCEWSTDLRWTVPAGARSGVYALRVTHGAETDWIPFFVVAGPGRPEAKTLLLLPTATYLAYANAQMTHASTAQSLWGQTPVLDRHNLWLQEHPEFGGSTYDIHSDGTGIHYSSWRRPIITLRPQSRTVGQVWGLPADLHLIAWLERQGVAYDVATDRELQDEGLGLLERYKVVLTGSHPEYYSAEMLDAWEQYLAAGGRCMYLGGNGFYWAIAWHPTKRHLMEVRRGEVGTRTWQAPAGEQFLQSNGLRSGLWRSRARAPQKLFGVGFTSQGFDRSSYYLPLSGARDPRAAFVMEGIGDHERIGDFGLVGGGAAGSELDRSDPALGTPPSAVLLATSEGHSDNYPLTVEELFCTMPAPGSGATLDPDVRADMVYFTTREGGAVFSTGSIAWCGSLLENDGDNNVSRLTANVLRHFAADGPLRAASQEQ